MRETEQGGDRARGDPLQGAARGDAPDGRRAGDGDDAVRRRSRCRRSASTRSPEASEVKTTKRELDIAKQLIDSLAGELRTARSTATRYREQVLALIERKAQGEEIAVQPAPEEVAAPAPDLMSALKASLEAVRERTGEERTATKRQAPRQESCREEAPPRKRPPRRRPPPKKPAASRAPAKR